MGPIYSCRCYKEFLLERIKTYPSEGRGLRKKLADYIGCQMPYLTQVFSGKAHLSLEQAEATARFFRLNERETEFFLLLVNFNRAGSPSLRNLYGQMLQRHHDEFALLKNRLGIKEDLKKEHQHIYYSSWHYAAVHVALQNEDLRTSAKISHRLGIPIAQTNTILDFLTEQGLASQNGNEYVPTSNTLHLRRDSPCILQHHTNWRLKALQFLADNESSRGSIHYSGVIICGKKDLELIRERMSKALEDCMAIVKDSPPEELAVLGIDFFRIGRA